MALSFRISLLSMGLALCLGASNGPAASRTIAPAPPAPSFAYPAPEPAPGTPWVGVIGDSTANQLVQPLAARLNPRGVGVINATVNGCQSTDLVLTYGSPEYFARHQNCPQDAQQRQDIMTARFSPTVVIWSDTVDWSDIRTIDRTVAAGSDQWRRLMFDGWDRVLRRLGTADVVLILPTWWAGYPIDGPAVFPVTAQRDLVQAWAARHPGHVTVVDLGPLLCPSGPPCPQTVNGVQLRSDHIHYTPEGVQRVIAKLMTDATVLKEAERRPG